MAIRLGAALAELVGGAGSGADGATPSLWVVRCRGVV
jgi:hypothetical protein